jgi:DNA-binding MarR family transcriptional regulator
MSELHLNPTEELILRALLRLDAGKGGKSLVHSGDAVAGAANILSASLSSIFFLLAQKGLIERVPGVGDEQLVRITTAGSQAIAARTPPAQPGPRTRLSALAA